MTSSRLRSPLVHPDPGVYPSGHRGFSRAWDGAGWTGPVLSTPDAPELRTPHPFWGGFRHLPFWVVVIGLALGWSFAVVAGLTMLWPLYALSGLFGTGGPILGLVLIIRKRVGIHVLRAPAALWWGLGSGVLAIGLAILVEWPINAALPKEVGFVLAGPIEEGAKLLLPFVLLLVGPRIFRDPRIGIWTVALSGAVFGVVEGIEYLLSADHSRLLTGFTPQEAGVAVAVTTFQTRAFVELGHVVWTVGAAALIWLTAHRLQRAFTWIGVVAYLIAAGLHSFNDAVLGELGGLGGYLAIVWLVLGYTLWFRPRSRQAVPPDILGTVPKRWVPRLSKRARREARPAPAADPGPDAVATA
jgi:hypothetical protein